MTYCRLHLPGLALCLCATFAFLVSIPAFAVHDLNTFELDRDAVDSNGASLAPDDWDTLYAGGSNNGGSSFAFTGIVADPMPESSIFTGGGSKNVNDINQWKWKNPSISEMSEAEITTQKHAENPRRIQAKENITNAYAAPYNVNGNLVIHFGLDRWANSNNTEVGFWFFKNSITLLGDGTTHGGDGFEGLHANGDILVTTQLNRRGKVESIRAFAWQDGTLTEIASGSDCSGAAESDPVCASANAGDTPSPWPYTPRFGSAGIFPRGSFIEGAINLTALGLTEVCFSSFLAETKSAPAMDAALKDFVGPVAFRSCTLEVTKNCSNPRLSQAQDTITYDIGGSVTANGFGAELFNITLSDTPPADGDFIEVDCGTLQPSGGAYPIASLKGTTCYSGTMTVPLADNGLSDTMTVTANTKTDGTGATLTDQETATCPNLQISPALSVVKDCATQVVVENGQVVVQVNVTGRVCNIGDSNLNNVIVDDEGIITNPDPLVNGVTLTKPADAADPTEAEGACISYSGSYFPATALDFDGVETTDPNEVIFKDTVKATATDLLGNQTTPQTDMADCPLVD